MDGDGDGDIVAVSLLSSRLLAQQADTTFESLIWLEQISPGKFDRHTLEVGKCHHAALEMADFDNDGDLDLAVPNFSTDGASPGPVMSIWWNERK